MLGAHTKGQWRWTGPISELGTIPLPADRAELPGLVVVGEVVSLAERIAVDADTEAHHAIA